MSKTWFVVVRRNGTDSPALWHDYLPAWVTGKHARDDYGVQHVEELSPERSLMPLRLLWDEHRRAKAYQAGNERHPLPISGTVDFTGL